MQFLPLSRGNRDKLTAELVSLLESWAGLSGGLSHLRSLFTGHVHIWGTPIREFTTPLHCSPSNIPTLLITLLLCMIPMTPNGREWCDWIEDRWCTACIPTLVYRLLRKWKLPSTSEETEKIVKKLCRPASSRISVCRPALKCIVNRWVVMVKPVPVFYLAKKTSICVVWEPIRKFYCCNRSYNNKGDLRPPLNHQCTTPWSFFVCFMFPIPNIHIRIH